MEIAWPCKLKGSDRKIQQPHKVPQRPLLAAQEGSNRLYFLDRVPADADHLMLGISLEGLEKWIHCILSSYDVSAMGDAGEEEPSEEYLSRTLHILGTFAKVEAESTTQRLLVITRDMESKEKPKWELDDGEFDLAKADCFKKKDIQDKWLGARNNRCSSGWRVVQSHSHRNKSGGCDGVCWNSLLPQ